MNWDLEVDLVCTGSGVAGLATAVSAVDCGGDVFVADGPKETGHPWLDAGVSDADTIDYFAALSSGLGTFGPDTAEVPISVVHETSAESGIAVAPFCGARLQDWAGRCLASPYGYLHTRVSDWRTTTFHTTEGETIEVAEVGVMTPDSDDVGGAVLDWLAAQARDRGIDIDANCSLQRIVFDEGAAVGAVFDTPDGALAIRARHGVTIATGGSALTAAAPAQPSTGDAAVRVCLVGRHASRFGRVELLTWEPASRPAPSACPDTNRQLQANFRETQRSAPAWRCGRGDGYPPLDR